MIYLKEGDLLALACGRTQNLDI